MCSRTYHTHKQLEYVYPIPIIKDKFVLDVAIRATEARAASIILSTDASSDGMKYKLGKTMSVSLYILNVKHW